MPEAPRVGVVIPNFEQRELLAACLRSWQAVRWPALTVLVSDDASADGAPEMVRREFPAVRLLEHRHKVGFTGAANAGFRALAPDHPYLFLCNNDTEVDAGLLEALVAAAEADPRRAALGPKILFAGDPGRVWSAGARVHRVLGVTREHGWGQPDDGRWDQPGERDYLSGCGLLLRSSVCAEAGFFREELGFQGEDNDLCWTLRARGYRVWYEPKARMRHWVSMSLGSGSAFSYYYFIRNMLALSARHREVPLWRLRIFCLLALVAPAEALRFALRGDRQGVRAVAMGAWDWARGRYGLRWRHPRWGS